MKRGRWTCTSVPMAAPGALDAHSSAHIEATEDRQNKQPFRAISRLLLMLAVLVGRIVQAAQGAVEVALGGYTRGSGEGGEFWW